MCLILLRVPKSSRSLFLPSARRSSSALSSLLYVSARFSTFAFRAHLSVPVTGVCAALFPPPFWLLSV
jgi:hypothetical protein